MFTRLQRVLHTFTFRLGLIYVGLFGCSAIVLFAFIYTFAMNYLAQQVSDSLRQQYNSLVKEYREGGSYNVEERIKEFIATDDEGTAIYLLVNREYEKLAGNLNEWPENAEVDGAFEKDGQWVRFHIAAMRGDAEEGIEVKAITMPLSPYRNLLVGQSLQNVDKIEQTIVQTFWASLVLTLCMASIGALVMTRSVMRRLSVINRSAKTIMGGHLSVRVPVTPGGDEFDELSANLNLMLDRIEALLKSLSEFAGNIAHDLRSPLNRIINRLDAGLRGIEKGNPAHSLLEKNIHEMQELVATFNAILKISELETGAEAPPFERCDLGGILNSLVELYEPYAAEKHIMLSGDTGDAPAVYGERHLLTQAFANLVDNAIKFTPEGGKVMIACHRADGLAEIVIADSGPGIPPEYREKVFEKFFRLEQSRSARGNGLGLSLVAAVMRMHNASLALADNRPGLKVIILMPLA